MSAILTQNGAKVFVISSENSLKLFKLKNLYQQFSEFKKKTHEIFQYFFPFLYSELRPQWLVHSTLILNLLNCKKSSLSVIKELELPWSTNRECYQVLEIWQNSAMSNHTVTEATYLGIWTFQILWAPYTYLYVSCVSKLKKTRWFLSFLNNLSRHFFVF